MNRQWMRQRLEAFSGLVPRYEQFKHPDEIIGAAQYITELHREVKNRRFSALISCQYNLRDRKKIVSTERLTPLSRHEWA